MKTVLTLALVLFASSSVVAYESGDEFNCADEISGYSYYLKIEDIGDESSKVVVRDIDGSVLKKFGYDTKNRAHYEEYQGGSQFLLVYEQGMMDQIVFEPDHNAAYFMDGGDSRSVDCIKLK